MKKASKEAYNKNVKRIFGVLIMFFKTKQEVSVYEAIQRLLSMPTKNCNNDVVYIPTDMKKIEC